jgi:hypothetical protein
MVDDAKNIPIRGEATGEAAALVRDRFVLDQISQASRVAVAYALVKNVAVHEDSSRGAVVHNFNIATIDPGGRLQGIVGLLRPDDPRARSEPYRYIESLMNEGLRKMAEDMKSGELNDIQDLIALGQAAEEGP